MNINFYAFSALINSLIFFFLFLVLILKKDKPRAANYFNIFNASVLFWAVSYFFWQTSHSYDQALFWAKMLMVGAIMVSPALFNFAVVMAGKEKQLRWLVYLSYFTALIFQYYNWTSPLFIADLQTKMGISYFPTAGWIYYFHVAHWTIFAAIAFVVLFLDLRQSPPEEKHWKRAVFISTLIAVVSGMFNYFLWFNVPIPPVTTLVVSIYAIVMTVLLLKGKFYRMNLSYFEFFAGSAVLISILQFALREQLGQKFINATIFGLVILASYIMVKVGWVEKKNVERITASNQALKDSMRQIADSSAAPIIIVSNGQKIIMANNSARVLFGYDESNQPLAFSDFVRAKINTEPMNAWENYWQKNETNAQVAISVPVQKQLSINFYPFADEAKNDSAMLVFNVK